MTEAGDRYHTAPERVLIQVTNSGPPPAGTGWYRLDSAED
jgi:hypothetical protein